MNTNSTFICGLHNIEVKEDLGDGIILVPSKQNSNFPQIRLTNNRSKIISLLDKSLSKFIGEIEYNHILNGYPLVAFAEFEFDLENSNSIEYLDEHLLLLKGYFFCLWLTKDNAADFDIGFLQFKNKDGDLEVSANTMTTTNFDVSGSRKSTNFSLEDLYKAVGYLKNFSLNQHKNTSKIASASSLSRVSMANYFVQSATVANDLGLKAVGYCSVLETLFANGDNTELAHKLSERVAKFLESELEERKEVYRCVKKIYEIRSKVVHGATFKPQKITELSELIKKADQLSRRVMTYALTVIDKDNIFYMSKENLDNYFLELNLK